jgi:tetratricopeptide (TPR) repeat protein
MHGKWIRKPSSDSVMVFIHGILSSGEACWLNSESGCYWPELLSSEDKLFPIGIYVFTYQTDIFSAGYRISDVVVSAITLSELYVSMGDLRSAARYAQEAINQADCMNNLFHQQVSRSTLADAMHQSGEFDKANQMFEAAEAIEMIRRPARPLLSSMQGYAYCDLLISQGRIGHVEQHAKQTLEWALDDKALLAAALDFLTLGRIHSSIESQRFTPDFTQATGELEASIEYVWRAGAEFRLPCMLLAKAALFRFQKKFPEALMQVEDAMLTSANHEMRLQEADCHLECARIYQATGDLQLASENYLRAKRIIGEVGYGRRAKELADLSAFLPN